MLLVVTGCATNKSISNVNDFTINENSTNEFKITATETYADDGAFIVSGKIKRKNVQRSYPGHVDVTVRSADGDVIDHVGTKLDLPFLGRSNRKNSSFSAQFSEVPPKGSNVSVNFHKKSYIEGKQVNCDINADNSSSQ